ncbi:hypothetical protein LWI29_004337 [Acer saccharum]|uniref:Uncharacterized protein n=1 Tax=Acer saccharum TaxID=4024 RepID=A0AA39SCJ0_ACESA|nr:hypothetical protein LWI29_004337 [Acer saccharum]
MERADWLEDLEAVTICSKSQENDSRKMGVAGQVRRKSSSLDSQSNHRAWTKGDVKEDRGGIQVPSDVSRERNIKVSYSLKTPEKGKGQEEIRPLLEVFEAQIQNMDALEDRDNSGLLANNIEMDQIVIYAQESHVHPTVTSGEESAGSQLEERISPVSSDLRIMKLMKKGVDRENS